MATAPRGLPLIVAPDVMPQNLLRANCRPEVQHLWDMMTATSASDPILKKALGETARVDRINNAKEDRPKIYLGYTHTTAERAQTDAYLTYKRSGDRSTLFEKEYSPRIKAGYNEKSHLKSLSFDVIVNDELHVFNQYLRFDPWNDIASMAVFGLTTKKSRVKAWKRWLLRFWAAVFPDVPILRAIKKETGDSATSTSMPSSKRMNKGDDDGGADVSTPKTKPRKQDLTEEEVLAIQAADGRGSEVYESRTRTWKSG